jgi:hypothetical protein
VAFLIEPKLVVNVGTFVVSPKKENLVREQNLKGEQQANNTDSFGSAIDIIPQEKVTRGGWEPDLLENSKDGSVLAMYVTTYDNGSSELEKHWLRKEKLLDSFTKPNHVRFRQVGRSSLDLLKDLDRH